jgi:hypothetical protein
MLATSPKGHPEDLPTSFGGVIARTFPKYKHPLPCFPAEKNWFDWNKVIRTPSPTGFLMNKPMKVGGSTGAGVTLRIAKSVAERLQATTNVDYQVPLEYPSNKQISTPLHLCKSRFDHSSGIVMKYRERIREQSFLFSILREPTSRWASEFFHFAVSRHPKLEPTDANFIQFIRKQRHKNNYYLQTLSNRIYGNSTGSWPLGTGGVYYENVKIPNDELGVRIANDILQDFDFIAVTERMEESVVAIQMILGLPTSDVLYLSAKRSGGWDDGGYKNTCYYVVPTFVSPGMEKWFESDEYRELVKWDRLLYQAVNRSLDLTIDALGRDAFNENLRRFQAAQKLVNEHCADEPVPCSSAGVYSPRNTSCLWFDSACLQIASTD